MPCTVSKLALLGWALTTAACGRGGFTTIAEGPLSVTACTALATPPASDVSDYNLPSAPTLPAGVSFATDWSARPTAGGFQWAQVVDACRVHVDALFQTSHGLPAARVEVDPHDDPLGLGDNSERAEVAQMQDAAGSTIDETAASGVQYYAFSYFFPEAWAGTQYPWRVFQTPGGPWPHGVSADCSTNAGRDCNSWSIVMQFAGWGSLGAAADDVGSPQLYRLSLDGQSYDFSDGGRLAVGMWTDFVMRVDWSSGAFSLWRRDEDQAGFTLVAGGVTGALAGSTMFKQGLYRGGTVNGRVDVLWLGPTARGSTFAAVERAAFGTSDGP